MMTTIGWGAGNGEQKYAWVTAELKKRGLPADEAHIENAVLNLQTYFPALGVPVTAAAGDTAAQTTIPAAPVAATSGGS
jgi:hypothetical protein